jgi:hypothetical protein
MKDVQAISYAQVNSSMIEEFIDQKDKEETRFEVLGAFLTFPYSGKRTETVPIDNFLTGSDNIHDMKDKLRRHFGQSLIKVFTTDYGLRAVTENIHSDEDINIYDFVLAIYNRKAVSRLED